MSPSRKSTLHLRATRPLLTLMRKKKRPISVLFLSGIAACCLAPLCDAQVPSGGAPPIRVESDQVVVPVLVLDKKRVNRIKQTDPREYVNKVTSGKADRLDDLVIRGLDAKDFHLFEDGQEQQLRSALFETESSVLSHVHDNLGDHTETAGIAGGIWTISRDAIRAIVPVVPYIPGPKEPVSAVIRESYWPGYLLAYSPPSSPDGSCHQLTIKLDRPGSLVYARKEYCSVKHSAADPLNGTALGREMQSDMASKRGGKIPLSVSAVPFFTTGPKFRVDLAIEWPAKSFELQGKDCEAPIELAVSGAIYRTDGDMALRFSDLSSLGAQSDQYVLPSEDVASCTLPTPNQYRTQIYLEPGEFSLRVVLKRGKEYGRIQIPLTVPAHDVQQLAVSGIALAKEFREAKVKALDASAKSAGVFVPLISNYVQYMPTANSHFGKGEGFYFYFEAANSRQLTDLPPCSDLASAPGARSGCAPNLQAHVRIVDAKTGEVVKTLQPINATGYAPKADPIISIGGGIHISELPEGLYRLEVQATDSSGRVTPWSSASFSIEDDPLAQKTAPEGGATRSTTEDSSDANAYPFVDEPLDRLVERIPELKALHRATDQEELPVILKTMGQRVDDFMGSIGDIIAHEDLTQEKLNAGGKVKAKERIQDEYLILHHGDEWGAGAEYRMDENGNRLESIGLEKGYMVTSGFALSCISFSTTAQPKSRFRYLGEEKIGPLETYVLGFAQRSGEATLTAAMMGNRRTKTDLLTQGILWVDKRSFQIIRMRMDLLSRNEEIGREQGTTDVTFSEVKLPGLPSPIWLPSGVDVYLEIDQQKFRNVHRYTNYRLYRVSVKLGASK